LTGAHLRWSVAASRATGTTNGKERLRTWGGSDEEEDYRRCAWHLALSGALLATDAAAFEWTESKAKTTRQYVDAGSCTEEGFGYVNFPGDGRAQAIISPPLSQQFAAAGEENGPVQMTSIDNSGGGSVWFYFRPVGNWCSPDPEWDFGWETTKPVQFSIRYQVRKRIVMTRNLAKNLTQEALSRRFSWFWDANHGGYRCRVSRNRGRCRHVFVIGDGAVIGRIRMRLVGRAGQRPLGSYRLNALQIDEYCRYVTHAGNCTTRFKKRRNRISLPSWVRAKTI
jgi:hypothetical protein